MSLKPAEPWSILFVAGEIFYGLFCGSKKSGEQSDFFREEQQSQLTVGANLANV